MSGPDREAVELFLQEASEHLQYLREYVGVLQEIEPRREDMERLYIAAHTLSGTSASYGYTKFSEVAGKLAHVFQYALNASLGEDLHGPLTEFPFWRRIFSKSVTRVMKTSKTLRRSKSGTALRSLSNRHHSIFLRHVATRQPRFLMNRSAPSSRPLRARTLMRCRWTTRFRPRFWNSSNRKPKSICKS